MQAVNPIAVVAATSLILVSVATLVPAFAADQPREPGGTAKALEQAIRKPETYAWELFQYVNYQADGSGAPDPKFPSLNDYEDDRDVVWEKWSPRPQMAGERSGIRLSVSASACGPCAGLDATLAGQRRNGLQPASAASAPDKAPGFEVRLNASAAAFVSGIDKTTFESAFKLGEQTHNCSVIQFPHAAKIAKAIWLPFDGLKNRWLNPLNPENLEKIDRFHWRTIGGKKYVLAGLNLMTKDVPGWFWTSFIQADIARGLDPTGDRITFSEPHHATLGKKWEHYRLIGTQQSFVGVSGTPTMLSNRALNEPYRASCISCHSAAGVNRDLRANEEFRSPGAPSPETFWEGCRPHDLCDYQNLVAIQTDFVWFIALQAEQLKDGP